MKRKIRIPKTSSREYDIKIKGIHPFLRDLMWRHIALEIFSYSGQILLHSSGGKYPIREDYYET